MPDLNWLKNLLEFFWGEITTQFLTHACLLGGWTTQSRKCQCHIRPHFSLGFQRFFTEKSLKRSVFNQSFRHESTLLVLIDTSRPHPAKHCETNSLVMARICWYQHRKAPDFDYLKNKTVFFWSWYLDLPVWVPDGSQEGVNLPSLRV